MANHNGGPFIEAAMRSVLGQTLESFELIVVDDASTDDSVARIEKMASEDPRVRLVAMSQKAGPGAARNRAFDIAAGDWLAVIDSDDLFHPRRLERLLDHAEAVGCDVIADDQNHFATNGPTPPKRLLSGADITAPRTISLKELLEDRFGGMPNHLGYLKPVIRRQALRDLRYRESLRIGEDFDLLLRIVASGAVLTVLPDVLYLYRRHEASVSHRLGAREAQAMLDAMREFQRSIGTLPTPVADRVARRIALMERGAKAAAVVDALKRRRPLAAAGEVLRTPATLPAICAIIAGAVRKRFRRATQSPPTGQPLVLVAPDAPDIAVPSSWETLRLLPFAEMSVDQSARLTASTSDRTRTVLVLGQPDMDTVGFIPEPVRLVHVPSPCSAPPLVHVRTPTYRRPAMLRRALRGLQAQTVADWICDVYDDDPDCSGRAVVEELNDPRIRYTANNPQRRASRNLDFCFSRFNPHGARYFFVLEDDNQVMPRFIEDNIAICEQDGARIVLRNQLVEHDSGTPAARLGERGLLDTKFAGGFCTPETLHLSIMADMGVSNGGLFWSAEAHSDLEIGLPCSSTLQEYLRTLAIVEPVYVALEPLAIWAENGENTVRDLGEAGAWFRREIDLKRSVQHLQRRVWKRTTPHKRRSFLDDPTYCYPARTRAMGLVKSLSWLRVGRVLNPVDVARLACRGLAIRLIGRPNRGLDRFLNDRHVRHGGPAKTPLP